MPKMKAPYGGGNMNIGGIEYAPDETGHCDINPVHVDTARSHGYIDPQPDPAPGQAAEKVAVVAKNMKRGALMTYLDENNVHYSEKGTLEYLRALVQDHADKNK